MIFISFNSVYLIAISHPLFILYFSYIKGLLVFDILLSQGENNTKINAKDSDGYTPLHWAAYKNSNIIGKLLIRNGADINAKDSNGKTPRDYDRLWID